MADMYLGVWEQTAGSPWVARHGLNGAQYQALFDQLVPQGYRPTILNGYSVGSEVYYLAVFEQAQGAPWVARHGLNGAQYQALFDQLVPQGYRPTILNGYNVGSEVYYLAMFEQTQGPAWVARHGLNGAQYQALFDQLVPQGYRPTILNGYNVGSEVYYLAMFEQTQGPAWVARHGLNGAQYQALFDEFVPQGYRPTILNGYSVGSEAYYLAVFEQAQGPAWVARHGLNGAQYQALWDELTPQGYRPKILSAYGVPDPIDSSEPGEGRTNVAPHVRIELLRVHCGNTEDVTGADEFYVVGAISDGQTSNGILTSPMSINDNQLKPFDPAQAVIFDADVQPGTTIRGGIKAFDEDVAKDWAQYSSTVQQIGNAVTAGLQATGDPRAATAGQILDYGLKAVDYFASHDKDDKLGTIELNIPVEGPPVEEHEWHFWNDGDFLGYSSWNYSVYYRITRS